MVLRIDPEFQNKIPPLTEAEFEQLKENILSDGEVYEPIAVWNGTIVDGHNRWKIIQENPDIPYKVREMKFADKWEAFDWMYKKQLGRRNLTEELKEYLIGKRYEAQKNMVGAPTGNDNAKKQSGQNVQFESRRGTKDGTAGEIGKEYGIDGRSVRRAEKFSKGIDAIREEFPETANSILKGELPVSKTDVMEIAKESDKPTLREKIEKLKAGEPIREKKPQQPTARIIQSEPIIIPAKVESEKPREFMAGTRENRELNRKIREGIAMMYDTERDTSYTLKNLIDSMKGTFEMYLRTISSFYQDHKELYTKGNKSEIDSVYKELIDEIKKIKEEIKYA